VCKNASLICELVAFCAVRESNWKPGRVRLRQRGDSLLHPGHEWLRGGVRGVQRHRPILWRRRARRDGGAEKNRRLQAVGRLRLPVHVHHPGQGQLGRRRAHPHGQLHLFFLLIEIFFNAGIFCHSLSGGFKASLAIWSVSSCRSRSTTTCGRLSMQEETVSFLPDYFIPWKIIKYEFPIGLK
jgi:hypothetical protein